MSVIVSLNSPPCPFLFSLFPLIASHSSTLPRFSIKALCISSFNSRCPWFFILTVSIYLVFPSLSHPFSFSAVDQSGSAGSGQPLINAIRTDSALIGGTVFFKNILHYTVNLLHLVLLRFAVELFLNYMRLNISAIRVFWQRWYDEQNISFELNYITPLHSRTIQNEDWFQSVPIKL